MVSYTARDRERKASLPPRDNVYYKEIWVRSFGEATTRSASYILSLLQRAASVSRAYESDEVLECIGGGIREYGPSSVVDIGLARGEYAA